MNINFSTLKFNTNYVNPNFLINKQTPAKQVNSINEISFSGVSSDPIIYKLRSSEQSAGKIVKLRAELTQLENDRLSSKITQSQYEKKAAKIQEKIDTLTQQTEKLEEEIQKYREFRKRPNAAFIYDSSLTPKQKEQEIQKHPEFKTINQIAQETGVDITYSNKYFMPDFINRKRYIDISYPGNRKNYDALLQNSEAIISTTEFAREADLPKGTVESLAKRGVIKTFELTDIYNEQPVSVNFIPKIVLDKADNIRMLIPVKSPYYKSILPENNENLPLVPIGHLSKLGYGTKQQLYDMFKNGFLRGKEGIIEKDGNKYRQVLINITSTTAENNLELAKRKNKNYLTICELAKQLKVSRAEIERAIIEGELIANNEYLFSSPEEQKSGVCLYNPKNKAFIEKLAFEEQAKTQVLQEAQQTEELPKESDKETVTKIKSLVGLRSKIAWYLAPETRKVASELAKGDGFLARVIEKEQRIRASKDDESDTAEKLTEAERRKIRSYRKDLWNKAGTAEFKSASKQANKIVDLYVSEGIDAIEDPEIRKIIEEYMS